MTNRFVVNDLDWSPILRSIRYSSGETLPTYPGDLKAALLHHAGLANHPKGSEAYQIAVEIARLTTCCDPEIVYWFSRLACLISSQQSNK
jgi:hypothetical protein